MAMLAQQADIRFTVKVFKCIEFQVFKVAARLALSVLR